MKPERREERREVVERSNAPSEGKRPIHTVQLGIISAAIWENKTEFGMKHSVTLEQRYKDDSDKWSSSHSVFGSNLPMAEKALSKAFDYITALEEQGRN